MLTIIFEDEYLVAINKPHDLLVHRSAIAADTSQFALQLLRDQLGKKVFPVHRIDRKTGGILVFAFNKETERLMQQQFMAGRVQKNYLAIVRGYTADKGEIDYPLKKENGTGQEAITFYNTLARAELPVVFGVHQTSRYSLVEVTPLTGRTHQIRKHLSHIFHPIIGDRTHGCNKQNKLFTENWAMNTMLLHAARLSFVHPVTGTNINIAAPLQDEFKRMMHLMNWEI